MVLLVCILKDYDKVETVLLGLLELGVTGATVLEGRGMGQIVGGEMPIFAALRGLFPGSAADSHVLLVVAERARAEAAMDLIDRVAGPLAHPGSGIAFLLPVERALGLKLPLPDRR
jgi:hypothetical protein